MMRREKRQKIVGAMLNSAPHGPTGACPLPFSLVERESNLNSDLKLSSVTEAETVEPANHEGVNDVCHTQRLRETQSRRKARSERKTIREKPALMLDMT
jgi:hypothetical protein